MCTRGRHLSVYPGYTRYIEWTQYIVGKQRCVPGVVISMCIQGTRGILNGRCSIPRIVGKQGCVPGVAIVICIKGTGDILNDIEYSWLTAMCTCGRHLNTYPRYTRYIEWTVYSW